ncbi:Uncharacterized membrane protein YqhA [Robiginitalea myxolifaciens]|uniref:Uncharacterized membrane protein YqhA n=1 Tax=Robiginitalea myxolifaciens TaxID=400055 RepID=A0A1I6FN32_9FLAO|nr:YqhA family protein [Robiginitalea myxolifaciens]SFR31341.1 Uncharacterized membrane protein YqhA [Robiginitalea myxolifaciens]
MNRILGWGLRAVSLVAVLAIIVLALGVEIYAFKQIYATIQEIILGHKGEDTIVKDSLKSLDLVLLGVILTSVATGLFELYIGKIPNLPSWLVIDDLDGLKSMLIKMIIFIMAVSFTGRIVTYAGGMDILYQGVGLAAVILALTFFLQKN